MKRGKAWPSLIRPHAASRGQGAATRCLARPRCGHTLPRAAKAQPHAATRCLTWPRRGQRRPHAAKARPRRSHTLPHAAKARPEARPEAASRGQRQPHAARGSLTRPRAARSFSATVLKVHFIQNSSGGHINVNHNISFHLFQNFTTAEVIRHKLSCSGKAAKNSCIFHTFKFTCVHTRNHYFPVAL